MLRVFLCTHNGMLEGGAATFLTVKGHVPVFDGTDCFSVLFCFWLVGDSQGQVLSHAMNGSAPQRPLSPLSYPPPPTSLHPTLQRHSRGSGESRSFAPRTHVLLVAEERGLGNKRPRVPRLCSEIF